MRCCLNQYHLRDYNGDGRNDLLTFQNSYDDGAVLVYLNRGGSTSSAPSPPPAGFEKVNIYNCTHDRRPLYLWLLDKTLGQSYSFSPLMDHYDTWSKCPGDGAEPLDISLTDGHAFELTAVDPALIGCGVNDPTVAACQRQKFWLRGKTGGGTLNLVIPAPCPPQLCMQFQLDNGPDSGPDEMKSLRVWGTSQPETQVQVVMQAAKPSAGGAIARYEYVTETDTLGRWGVDGRSARPLTGERAPGWAMASQITVSVTGYDVMGNPVAEAKQTVVVGPTIYLPLLVR
jgi:hypothetical protein